MNIVTVDQVEAKSKFLKKPFMLRHGLADHPLFDLSKLVELAKSMPRDRIEYNSGKVAVGVRPEDVPTIELAPAEVVKTIETANAWMVIKNVEERPEYRALLEQFVTEANNASGRKPGEFSDLQGFIFVSSANSTTPFHVDAEENILIQIKGDKLFTTFDNDDRSLVSEEALEISPSKHRNQKFDESFAARATLHKMKPGDALHVPYYTPHWVGTGNTYSISMAMTWKTPEVLRLNKIRLMNGTLRRFGLPQKPPGRFPALDAAKVIAHDAMRMVIDPIRKSEGARRALRALIYGKSANYYYTDKPKQTAGM
jgi:ribosomal protein L16 Arg81 hydroxylase